MNIVLIYFAIKYNGDWNKIYEALEAKEAIEHKELIALEEEVKKEEEKGIKILTVIDPAYPEQLKDAYKPPFVLWVKGDLKALDKKFIQVIGDETDETAMTRIKEFTPEILKNHTLVAGTQTEVETEAVLLSKDKPVLVVMDKGIDAFTGDDKDVVITEYPRDTRGAKDRTRNTNRIRAAYGQSVIVIKVNKESGLNNVIVNYLNLGKEVYVFPGDGGDNDGNSELIKQGASLITSIKDIA